MKIGFDAKWFHDGPPSGRRVTRGLVRSLCRRMGDDQLHLFLDRRFAGQWQHIDLPRSQQHYVWAGNNQLSNLWNLPRAADRASLDVVAYQNFVPVRANAHHARIAFVHGVMFADHPRFFTAAERLYFSTLRPLTRGADRVCTVSTNEKLHMATLGFARTEHIDVVPHGIDDVFTCDAYAPTDAGVLAGLDVRPPYALYVGRLTAGKNVPVLIRAMQHVATDELSLVIVGERDRTGIDLPALAAELELGHRVRFTGAIFDERLAALYRNASVFCFPTLGESFGLPPLEAMGCGTPCIVSELAVLRDTYGDAAVFVNPRDERALAAAINDLLSNQARAAELRSRGLARVAHYTWDRAAELFLHSARAAVAQRN